MSELDEKLNALLSGTFGGASQPASASPPPPPPQQPPQPSFDTSFLGGLDPKLIGRFLPLIQEYTQSNSNTTQLLYALRPFLKAEKQDKIERAAKLARLIHLGKKFLSEWEV